jgi:hypothetical protein
MIISAVGAIVAFMVASTTVLADELVDNLGPVPPHEPILAWVGSERIIAFYHPDGGNCVVHLVVWNPKDVSGESAAGFKTNLSPQQMGHVDAAENESAHLQCEANAERLALVDTSKCVKFVAAISSKR